MADNFNLRTFLTENNLTKNAKLLKEEQEDYKYFDEEGTGGFYMTTIDGHKIYSMEDSSVMDTCFYAIIDPDGNEEFVGIDVAGEPISSEEIQNEYEIQSNIADFIEADINAELGDGLDENKAGLKEGTDISRYWVMYGGLNKGVPMLIKIFPSEEQAQQALQDAPTTYGQHVLRGNWGIESAQDWLASGKEIRPDSMGHPDRVPRKPLSPEELAAIRQLDFDAKMERESVDNKKPIMKETNLTAKERRLVEMVNSAMGIGEEEGHQNADPNVPNDSTDMAIDMMKNGLPEGEEMVQDKPLPKYESIEELMKEIEHGTNEAAHKYKMEEMKRVYEALEAKVGALEEGEHAEHIDQKAVKQMRKDIAALRKAEEKLRKEFDKKFSGKEKKETPAKEKATEALQENIMENFNLKKFLVENKLTTNSRMLNEKLSYDDFEQMIKPFLDLAKSKGWVWNSSGNSWYDMSSPAIALFHKDVVPTTKDGEYKGQPTELGTNPVAGRSMNVRGPLETKSADVIMSPDYNIEQAYFSAKDKTILDSIKGAMANNTDVIQDIKQTSSEFTSGGDFEPQNYYVMLLRKKGA